MTKLTQELAQFIASADTAEIGDIGIDKAKKVIIDTFAVILSGAGSEVAPPTLAFARQAGSGNVPAIGTSDRFSPPTSALVQGTFGAALDFDDVLSMMPGHPRRRHYARADVAVRHGQGFRRGLYRRLRRWSGGGFKTIPRSGAPALFPGLSRHWDHCDLLRCGKPCPPSSAFRERDVDGAQHRCLYGKWPSGQFRLNDQTTALGVGRPGGRDRSHVGSIRIYRVGERS